MKAAFAVLRLVVGGATLPQGCAPLVNVLSQINCTAARKIAIVTKEDEAPCGDDEAVMSYIEQIEQTSSRELLA
jgi:hypothetical protein